MRGRAPARIPSVGVEQVSEGHQGGKSSPAELDRSVVAEVLASVAYGELCGARRSEESVKLAPDGRTRTEQRAVADRELQNYQLIEARLKELGDEQLMELFRPYFDA